MAAAAAPAPPPPHTHALHARPAARATQWQWCGHVLAPGSRRPWPLAQRTVNCVCARLDCWLYSVSRWFSYMRFCLSTVSARRFSASCAGPGRVFFI